MKLFQQIAVFLVMIYYFIGSSGFAHGGSMHTYTIQQDALEQMRMMEDCTSSTDPTKSNCIIACAETDDTNLAVAVPTTYKEGATKLCIRYTFSDVSLFHDHADYRQDPPDERSIAYGKQMPYFSHKDTTKLE